MTLLAIITLVLLVVGSSLVLYLVWVIDRMEKRIEQEKTD